jgi:hypothetical protein
VGASPDSVERNRFARAVAASKRIRWDIDKDVIRELVFDTRQKFLPDGLTKIGFNSMSCRREEIPQSNSWA